jgi:hypothetical protein
VSGGPSGGDLSGGCLSGGLPRVGEGDWRVVGSFCGTVP